MRTPFNLLGIAVATALAACGGTPPRRTTDAGEETARHCGASPILATPEELAASPRASAEAELLAIEAGGGFTSEQSTYDSIVADLARIRQAYPGLRPMRHLPEWIPESSLLVRFDAAFAPSVEAGTYDAWNCLNEAYGMVELDFDNFDFIRTVEVKFGSRFDTRKLVAAYQALPGVEQVDTNGVALDGPDICAELSGPDRHYVIDTSNDATTESCTASSGCVPVFSCDSGCLVHDYTWFRVRDGALEKMATLHTDHSERAPDLLSDPEPAWWRERWNCVRWLHQNQFMADHRNGEAPPPSGT